MRGLKQEDIDKKWTAIGSHLLQMRGLKLARAQEFFRNAVASFTDAWIETLRYLACGEYGSVASFTDAWIETMIINILYYIQSPHLLQMRGLKLIRIVIMVDQLKSHLLQMRGLKPRPSMDSHRQNQVASFTDAWIETCAAMARFWRLRRIFYRCVD